MRPRRQSLYRLLLAIAPLATSAHAATRTWTNPLSGTFSISTNWTGGFPGTADTARFSAEASSSYTVTFSTNPTNDTLLYLQDNVIFNLAAHTYTLTDASSSNQSIQIGSSAGGTLLIKSSAGIGTLSSQYTSIGRASNGTGSLTIDAGALLSAANNVLVGDAGIGSLTLQAGGHLSASSLVIGNTNTSTGSATLTGTGSSATSSAPTYVGYFGRGSLNLLSGASLSTSSFILANNAGSTGTATLTGSSTSVISSSDTVVGLDGSASLSLSNAATLSNVTSRLALSPGATGTATLSDSSSWNTSGSFYVGGDTTTGGGRGTLNLPGGTLSVTGAFKIWNTPNTSVNLSGGTLSVGTLDTNTNPALLNWTSGSLSLTNSSLSLSSTGPLGSSLTLNTGMSLNITGSAKTLSLPSGSSLTLNGGTLNATTTFSPGSSVNLLAGSLTLPASTFSSTLTNNASVAAPTTGTLTFAGPVSGSGSYTGNTLFKSSLSPGTTTSTSAISLATTTFASTSTLNLKLAGTSQFDQLSFSNSASLNGTLNVSLLNSFSPSSGQTFHLFNGTTTGSFSALTLPAISPLRWNTNLLYSDGTLHVRPASESLTWSSALTGTFSDYTKWSTGLAAPDSPDTAVFNNAASTPYTVTLSGAINNDRLLILHDNVNLSLADAYLLGNASTATPGISVGSPAGASLSITGSSFINDRLGANNIVIAPVAGDIGNISLNSSNYSVTLVADSLFLGGSATAAGGAGTLNIPTGNVTVSNTLKIWNTPNTSLNLSGGTLNVGALDLSSNLSLLHWTIGTLNFTNSNLILNPTGLFGSSLSLPAGRTLEISNSSTLTVDAGSTLSLTGGTVSSGSTTLGSSPGSASLSITAGSFSSNQIYFGYNAGSTGSATLTGASSFWTSSLTPIGSNGAGSLNILAGAKANLGNCYLATSSTSFGALTIDGPSTTATGAIFVGEGGNASLAVQNGASLLASAIIAALPGSTGTATLSGSSSSWLSGSIYIGGNSSSPGGKGTLNLQAGTLTDTGPLKIWNTPGSALNLSGGTLSIASLDTDFHPATLNWTAGTLDITASSLSLDYPSPQNPLGQSLTLSTGQTLRISGSAYSFINGVGTLNLSGGTLYAHTIDLRSGTTNFSSGTLQIDTGILYTGYTPTPQTLAGAITGSGSLQKDSTTSLTLTGPLSYTGLTHLNQGTLALATPLTSTAGIYLSSSATLRLLPGSSIHTSNLLFPTFPATATVDLTTTSLTFSFNPYNFTTLQSLLANSYDHGHWDLPGINSSTAAANPLIDSVGYIENDANNTFTILFTRAGDINLDGKLDADDYALLDRSYAKYTQGSLTNPHWTTGDFNYDGTIDANDYLLIDTSYGQAQGLSPGFLSQRQSQFGDTYVQNLIASVPEPTSLLTACGFALLRGRRTRLFLSNYQ